MELKPCPFCGGKPYLLEEKDAHNNWYSYICDECNCKIEYERTLEDAIALWNRRVVE